MSSSTLLDQGIEAHSRGDLETARTAYERVLAAEPNNPDALHLLGLIEYHERRFDLALALIRKAVGVNANAALFQNSLGLVLQQQGHLHDADAAFRRAVALDADFAEAYSNLSGLCVRQGKPEQAIGYSQRAIQLNSNLASAHCHLGEATYHLNRRVDARRAFGVALAIEPTNVDALNGLGLLLCDEGKWAEALRCFERAVTHHPNHPASHTNLGNILGEQGRATEALEHHQLAARLDPASAKIAAALAATYHALGRFDEAIQECRRAIGLDPGLAVAHANLGSALAQIGQTESARAAYRNAMALRPDPGLQIRSVMTIPPILESVGQINHVRQQLAAGLAELMTQDFQVRDPLREVGATLFYLAYHGLNDRDLQREAAQLYEKVCPSLLSEASHTSRKERRSGKLRIGIISAFLYNHSIGKTSAGIVAHLSREQFHVVVIHVGAPKDDEIGRFISTHADERVVLEPTLEAARRRMTELNLDILFYQDIGMDVFSYFLAYSRLAPVQCVSFGHPDTTGVPNMDYWVSNDLFEPPGAAEHYSEQLFLLHDLPTLAYYYRPEPPNPLKDRSAFDLPTEANLYICPQTLFKFHPDFDAILVAILRGDPEGRLVIIGAKTGNWTDLLLTRWRTTMPDLVDRVIVLPSQGQADFLNLLAVCDVMLDTIHFNGMNSSLEGFAAGIPIVTMPTGLQRGRHTFGMYRKMGIIDCIAQTPEEYVDIALRLGRDPEFRQRVQTRITERAGMLYEDMNVVREFERFFLEAAKTAGLR